MVHAMALIIENIVSLVSDRTRMEAQGSARSSRKRKREGSNGEAEEGEKPLKLKRCTVVSGECLYVYVYVTDGY